MMSGSADKSLVFISSRTPEFTVRQAILKLMNRNPLRQTALDVGPSFKPGGSREQGKADQCMARPGRQRLESIQVRKNRVGSIG